MRMLPVAFRQGSFRRFSTALTQSNKCSESVSKNPMLKLNKGGLIMLRKLSQQTEGSLLIRRRHYDGDLSGPKNSSSERNVFMNTLKVAPVINVEDTPVSSKVVSDKRSASENPDLIMLDDAPISSTSSLGPQHSVTTNSQNRSQVRQLKEIRSTTPSLDFPHLSIPLKVVSYNVLCQTTMEATRELYTDNLRNKQHLWRWDTRWTLIERELDELCANVYCLQEVQYDHYAEYFEPFFKRRFFYGFYTRRSNHHDGCAIFYDSRILKPVEHFFISYNHGITGMDHDNVGQLISFNIHRTNSIVCISNTHIYYNMKRGEVKLAQIAYLLANIRKMEYLLKARYTESRFLGHIICGDFNILPRSPLYHFITNGALDLVKFNDRSFLATGKVENLTNFELSVDNAPLKIPPIHEISMSFDCIIGIDQKSVGYGHAINHQFCLKSVYEHYVGDLEEISKYHIDALCSDFIFYGGASHSSEHESAGFLCFVSRLTLPTLTELSESCGPMPNDQCGSDHLPLLATFALDCS